MQRNARVRVEYEATKPIEGSTDETLILRKATHRVVIDDASPDLRVACEVALISRGIVFKNILSYKLT